jgi:hypothetical protein
VARTERRHDASTCSSGQPRVPHYDFESDVPELATYDDLEPFQQKLVDTLGCDMPGR